MPQRLAVSRREFDEELRLWAEAIADLDYFVGLLAEHAPLLLPGEDVDRFRAAGDESHISFATVVRALDPGQNASAGERFGISHLHDAKLDYATGALKRSILERLRDTFLGYFASEPRSEEKTRLAAQAGARYADVGAMSLDSLGAAVSQVPLLSLACKAAEETLLVGKQLLEIRGQRR